MMSRLPRWVELGGFWLACIAGATNAVGLLGFTHQATSHLTGPATLLGVALASPAWSVIAHLVGIILSFVLGAAVAGLIVGNVALQLGRRYGVALLIEAVLLLSAMLVLLQGLDVGHYLAAAACGLQNGMVSTYSGAVVRTTHVTGMFTDIGTMLGTRLRRHPIHRRQLVLYLVLICGFILGGTIGGWLFARVQFYALLFPSAGAAGSAAVYAVFRMSGPSAP